MTENVSCVGRQAFGRKEGKKEIDIDTVIDRLIDMKKLTDTNGLQ